MKRSYIALIVIVAVVLIFPTPHSYTKLELVKTLDCSRTLQDGHSLHASWTNMYGWTKIEVNIQSTEEVNVKLKGIADTFYDSTKKVHTPTPFGRTDASFDISVTNPSLFGLGASAVMSGSIKAYKIVEYTEWKPWWMP